VRMPSDTAYDLSVRKFGARVRHVPRVVSQRGRAGAGEDLFGVSRQIECRELAGGVRRGADPACPRRHQAIAAFEPARECSVLALNSARS
jgi:hypothetical protein